MPRTAFAEEADAALQPNMDNVDLEDFIKFFGKYTGKNLVYRSDQIPKVKFNIYSREAISEPQLWAIFNDVLKSVGIQAVQKGDLLYVLPTASVPQLDHAFKPEERVLHAPPNELSTTVYQLPPDVPSNVASQFLQGLISSVGLVQDIPQARSVLIRETPERIQNMLQVLTTIQKLRPKMDVEVIKLEKATAENVSSIIKGLYDELNKKGLKADVPFIQPVVWSNSILFAGSHQVKEEVLRLIKEVDRVDAPSSGVRVYRLQNVKAVEVAKVLQGLVEVQQGDQRVSVSNDFKASADENTNSLLVICSREMVPQIEELMTKLDQPQNQVFIEALIMETTLTDSKQFGVEWMGLGAGSEFTGTVGYVDAEGSLLSYAEPTIGSNGEAVPDVNSLPGGFSLGVLGNMITYGGKRYPTIGALVNFVKDVSEINILSTPQVMTLDNAEAEVFIGENRPFLTTTKYDANNNPVQSYDYRDVGIKLTVTPHINSQTGLVRMDIAQEVKQISVASTTPTTLTRSTKTSIQLLDGSTVVISGLVRDDRDRASTGIPGLAQLPLLGWLFKSESVGGTKSTLMVFISARIIHTLDNANELTLGKMRTVEDSKKTIKKNFNNWYKFDGFGNKEKEEPTEDGAEAGDKKNLETPSVEKPESTPAPSLPAAPPVSDGVQTEGEVHSND